LPADAFLNFEIPLPPYEEQVEIVRQIDTVQRKINFEVKELRKQIEDLEELKSAIVSDVVTGKVDVRNITVPHYEHVDDIVDDDSENNEETETDGEEA
jgi:type I restriction enzyme S subunit